MTLYLLGPEDSPWLKRLDRTAQAFVTCPGIGGAGSDPRQFLRPRSLASSRRLLYVADLGNRRVQAFNHNNLALRHVWDSCGSGWSPVDVTARGDRAYILDGRGWIYEHTAGGEALRRVDLQGPVLADHWTRVAVDRTGLIYLVAEGTNTGPFLSIYDRWGRPQPLADADQVNLPPDAGPYRDRFDPPPLRPDGQGRFCLSADWFAPCDPTLPPVADLAQPLGACFPGPTGGRVFDSDGNVTSVDPAASVGSPVYLTTGSWISGRLDSLIHRCQWHRIELKLSALPAGTTVKVSTYASDQPLLPDGVLNCKEPDGCALVWDSAYVVAGSMSSRRDRASRQSSACPKPALSPRQSAPGANDPERHGPHEFLIHSREGRYLWVKVELAGDGYTTPAVASIKLDYPRSSYLNYLPAFYSSQDDGRRFLEAFLSVVQTAWDDLSCELSNFARYFDPKAVPAGEPLGYLAAWLGLKLDGSWTDEERRRLLVAEPKAAERRGTVAALRESLTAVLRNLAGPAGESGTTFPRLVEGFTERRHLTLGAPGFDRLGWVEPPATMRRIERTRRHRTC